MRQLVIDTETTGLNACAGDRLIEIACVELCHRRLTGNNLHFYLNPERESDPGALAIHGLSAEFLSDKPKFAEVATQLCEFVRGAEVIIHNAPFDLGFLDAELSRLGESPFNAHCNTVIDTLVQAKRLFPGKRHSLDALCDRFSVRRSHRKLHGALLDAELLARVYLAMTRGQTQLAIAQDNPLLAQALSAAPAATVSGALPVRAATPTEEAAHTSLLDALTQESAGQCIWRT